MLWFWLLSANTKQHSAAFGKQLKASSIRSNGLLCSINSLTLSVDNDMGYFDYNGFLFPKAFEMQFSLKYVDTEEATTDGTGGAESAAPTQEPENKGVGMTEAEMMAIYEAMPEVPQGRTSSLLDDLGSNNWAGPVGQAKQMQEAVNAAPAEPPPEEQILNSGSGGSSEGGTEGGDCSEQEIAEGHCQ